MKTPVPNDHWLAEQMAKEIWPASHIANLFDRTLYAQVVRDVKAHDPAIKLRDAWVYHLDRRDHWEFHYQDFYWHGSAGGAFEARAAGWTSYLRKKGVPGYADE